MEAVLKDERFARIAKDKKFRSVGKKQRKVQIDERFQSMFKDAKFVSKCSVDKRGRPTNFSPKENFKKYYALKDSEDESESEEEDTASDEDAAEAGAVSNQPTKDREHALVRRVSEEDTSSGDESIEAEVKVKLHNATVDYARGEANLYSDSSSDESSSEEEAEEEEAAGGTFDKWGELDGDAEHTEEPTRRLAVCNMDWDRVGPEDIFLALSSFCPTGGSLKRVDFYLSEFGRMRLEEEERLGPVELRNWKEQQGDQGKEEDFSNLAKSNKKAEKAELAARERVRQYQVNRLKYYYAVAEFDSIPTANRVYEECDGMEYELSATRFDLRFVPEDMEFTEATASATGPPDPDKYTPKMFFTTALQQGKVELTWDESDPRRQDGLRKAFDLLEKNDEESFAYAKQLIGSSSDEEEEETSGKSQAGKKEVEDEEASADSGQDEKSMIMKYKSLIAELGAKDKDKRAKGDMEITWVDRTGDSLQREEEDEDEEADKNLTPWQKYLKKKKDKKKMKKDKKKVEGETDSDENDVFPDDVDLNDPFFVEELGDVKSTKAEKKKKKKKKEKINDTEAVESEQATGLELLVMDSDDERNHFNYKTLVAEETAPPKANKKWKKNKLLISSAAESDAKPDTFDVDVKDERFAALFTRPEFNIDPSEPNFKKTKAMEKLIGEKQKRIADNFTVTDLSSQPSAERKKSRLDPETSSSLRTVKNKWKKNAKKYS